MSAPAAFTAHPTAVIDEPCFIGEGTRLWHFAHVCAGARIGAHCSLAQNVYVAPTAVLGDRVKVQNNVAIYDGVTLEEDVFLGPSCVLTNVSNPRSQVARRALYEKTLVRRGATIGANATIVCGITIGRYAFIAAGAVVTRDVPDYALMMGTPARQRGWMSRHGHALHFTAQGEALCPESKLRYRLAEGVVRGVDVAEDAPLPATLAVGAVAYRQFKQSQPS